MSAPAGKLDTWLLEQPLRWFRSVFGEQLVSTLQGHFPGSPLPRQIQTILTNIAQIERVLAGISAEMFHPATIGGSVTWWPLYKQIVLQYRRHRAAETEHVVEKTIHLEVIDTLEREVKQLDALVREDWFQSIEVDRLPRLADFLSVKLVEAAATQQELLPREYDQKFPILQAPGLFLPDLAYFRAKCADRESLLAIAYLDIDHFKTFNTKYTETKIDRNLLPRFMQVVEAHVYHHGYAYHEGGDEFMILVPSLSRSISIAFFDELRCKLAEIEYPDIEGKTTISLGLCVVEPSCPLTDRELRDRASHAKKFAKDQGRNCIAAYKGPNFLPEELAVVSAPTS